MRGARRGALPKASVPPTDTPALLMSRSAHRQTSSSSLLPAAARLHLDHRSFALDLGQVAVLALRRSAGHLTYHDGLDVVRNNARDNDHLLVTDGVRHHVRHHAL